jgi:uncharacterized protein (DUF427 family)
MCAESVWDYPRPPRVEPTSRRIRVIHGGVTLVDTTDAVRVLETSHPPTYYVPRGAVAVAVLSPSGGRTSVCEWKGTATYLDVVVPGRRAARAAWMFPAPRPGFEAIAGRVAFYAQHVDECRVDDERVLPQDGSFYGGWVTSDLIGPFKGGTGTAGW